MSAIARATTEAGLLQGCRVALTGRLATLTRSAAHDLVRRHGGTIVRSVTRRTGLLVIGMRGWPILPNGAVSGMLERAEELAAGGHRIEILSEAAFRERIGLDPPTSTQAKSYTAGQIAELLGIDPLQLRRWEQLSLVRSDGGHYDFRDLVSLRTIAALVSRGVRTEVIAESLRRFGRFLPDSERPLAQLRLVAEDPSSVLVECDGALIGADGQLRMDFGQADAPPPEARPRLEPGDPADDALQRGLECEEAGDLPAAITAYREALRKQPAFAEAAFNLGNVLRARGEHGEAEKAYRLAVQLDPGLAEGWYNLADMAEQGGALSESVQHLEQALRIDPDYADAHYNLARCLEALARSGEAARHWSSYLRLDPSSDWADAARRQLQRIRDGA